MKSQTETAISAALNRAGMNTVESRLRMMATDAMKRHHDNVERATKTLEKDIDGDRDLVREALRFYLERYRLPEADQEMFGAQSTDVGGRQTQSDERGQLSSENHETAAASSPRDGVGHSVARPVREPSPEQRAAAAAVAQRISVLDTFKISGRSIGDWSIVAAKSEGHHMAYHGQVLMELTAEAERTTANIESWMTFRDVLTEQKVQQCIQRASGVSNGS